MMFSRPAFSVHWYPASDLGKTVTKIVIDLQKFYENLSDNNSMIFRPVEIKEAKEKPDPSDQHESVLMEDHNDNGGDEGDHEEDLRHVEGPGLVGDVVQDDVGKGSGARHELVGEGEAAGVGHPAHAEEQEAHQGLERLPGDLLGGGELVHVILDADHHLFLVPAVLHVLPLSVMRVARAHQAPLALPTLAVPVSALSFILAVENVVQPAIRYLS